jgi:hypothetical protein
MAVTLNASTSSGFIQTADTSGSLVLQSNGTTQLTVDSTGVYGQVERGTAVASTSGTSIDFTSLPSWVKRITVIFNGVSTSGTSQKLVQIGTSGGVEATGYISTSSLLGSGSGSTASSTAGFLCNSASAAEIISAIFTIVNITGNTWVNSYTGKVSTSTACFGGGDKSLSGTLDRVRITTVNGTDTFDAGSINILYEG